MNYNNSTALIFAYDNSGTERILVIINNNGLINIPGGRRDRSDKDSYHTALREAAEETKDGSTATVNLKNLTYLWQFANTHQNGTVTHVNCYRSSDTISAKTTHVKNSEVKAVSWMRASYLSVLAKKDKLDGDIELLGKKYKMYGPCCRTFNKLHDAGLI